MKQTSSFPLFLSRLIVLFSAWSVGTGLLLSGLRGLGAAGVGVSFVGFVGVSLAIWSASPPLLRFRPGRYRRILPAAFLLILGLSFLGGILHAPNNYDFLTYRFPRLFHWMSEHSWHWTGSFNRRMDFSGTGSEWTMLPLWLLGRGERLFFLPNILMYACLPALAFLTASGLGIPRKAGWVVAWLVPGLAGAVMQAASVGNDLPGLFFFLAAMAFSLRAVRTKSWLELSMAIVAAALLTSVKASNIPLVLPVAIVLGRLLPWLVSRPWRLAAVAGIAAVSLLLSFVPVGIMNHVHTGSWNGDPLNLGKFQIRSPVAGIIGNTLQLAVNSLNPPIFPAAGWWNSQIVKPLYTEPDSPIAGLLAAFPRLGLQANELLIEENAGMGIGIALVLAVFAVASFFPAARESPARSGFLKCGFSNGLVLAGGLLVTGVFFAKFGNECGPRLLLPYYPVILLPFFSLRRIAAIASRRWARAFAGLAVLAILPSVVLSPSRPLLPPAFLSGIAGGLGLPHSLQQRIELVYSVYGNRNDNLAIVREHLPPDAQSIGFAGLGDESELSLWRPFGKRKITDLAPVNRQVPSLAGIDCVAGSEWGFRDRFGMSAQQFADNAGWRIVWSEAVATKAGIPPTRWFIIIPPKPDPLPLFVRHAFSTSIGALASRLRNHDSHDT